CIERAVTRGARADGYGNLATTMTLATTVAMTAVGANAIIEQKMSIGALIAASMLSGRMLGVLGQLVGNWRAYTAFVQSATRLAELFATPGERTASGVALPRPRGVIELDAVRFAYDEGTRPVIHGLSLCVEPGGITAVIGTNGSGKSTLLKLMQGLYRPDAGRVLLDGADITQFSRAELARWIGYVPQECALLAGSIGANIAHRKPGAGDEEIIAAARLAGVHAQIVDLPHGYQTDVGEAGRRLSAGQRQRLAIARALLGDPPLLLLDEPTASLDLDASFELRATLVALASERTVVVVTHSPQLLPVCRTVVQLHDGRVQYAQPGEQAVGRLLGLGRPAAGAAA
ncbi:MAG TPA: ATP-binding cassette domain-containing protein, partial [Rhodospirillales bacterium]|nr:ATP-binding cassette domain-containing protein [Rhodospirillales bacterium]